MGGIIQQKSISSIAVIMGIIFLAAICCYTFLLIYPFYRSFSHTRQAIVVQTAKLERLKILYPVFARSKTLDQIQFEHRLPFPRRVEIHRNELAKLFRKISDAAKQNQMILASNNFDINSLNNQSQSVSMVIKLKGDLFNFRRFLIDIISFEFFDSIETLSINTKEGRIKNFMLNLNIKIKKDLS